MELNPYLIDKDRYESQIFKAPREADKVWIPPVVERPKPVWSKAISVFNRYKYDTGPQFDKCFEFDWSCGRIPKLVKDP